MKKLKFKILKCKNYLQMIKNSARSKMFRSIFVLENSKEKDILKNGQLSCAYYVSCLLKLFDLISCLHATVDGAVKDMIDNSWKETKKLKPGNILIWEKKTFNGGEFHSHIGFYLGNSKAISNSDKNGLPIIHHYTYGIKNGRPKRKIIKILTHKTIK